MVKPATAPWTCPGRAKQAGHAQQGTLGWALSRPVDAQGGIVLPAPGLSGVAGLSGQRRCPDSVGEAWGQAAETARAAAVCGDRL
jgi:hypothetical protein